MQEDTGNTEVSIYDYGDKSIVFETRGLSVDESDDTELNTLFQSSKGNKIGVVFYGSEGFLVQKSYRHCIAYNKDMTVMKEFNGGDNHFGNFLDACQSRKVEDLNADVREGHLSRSDQSSRKHQLLHGRRQQGDRLKILVKL